MPAYLLTPSRREVVVAVLAKLAGGPVRLLSERPIGHEWAPVTHLVLDRELPGIGSSVVVKTRRVDGNGHGGPAFLRREAAGLRTAAASGVTAGLVHVDDAAGVVIQTDLGDWPSLQDFLMGNDPEAAATGMAELGTAVGRLHAWTLGRQEEHQRALDAFGADVDTGLIYAYSAGHWDAVEQACAKQGLPSAQAARDDVLQLFRRVTEPSPLAALTHMDLNPTNVLITNSGARLVDFEGCRFGCPGIDAAFLHYPFPHHSRPWGLLPAAVIESTDAAYRTALAEGGADQVLDAYDQMIADGAAITLIGRIMRLPLIARSDQAPHDSWRRRGQVVQQIHTYSRLAERADKLPDFVSWLHKLEAAMTSRWPDATNPPAPLFPAFTA